MPPPALDRPITLHFSGDWGQANLHRVFGWLSQELWDRTPRGAKFAIWTGRGVADATRAVGRGEVDVALSVPAAFVPAALEGTAQYEGEPFPDLRALAVIPQNDRMLFAVHRDLGVGALGDLPAAANLVIATSRDDGDNTIGYAVTRVLAAAGVARAGLVFLNRERPDQVIQCMLDGEANAVFHEAMMAPWWRSLAEAVPLAFLPVPESALASLETELGWARGTLPAGYLPGMDEELLTLDFSDFLMICRADLPEDVAYLITWCLVNTRENLERQYRHIPSDRAGITYPLQPAEMKRTTIPLHPGAARCYEDLGV